MIDLIFECAVKKSHPQRRFFSEQRMAPQCCGKPMTRFQEPEEQPTLPLRGAATAESRPTDKVGGKRKYT